MDLPPQSVSGEWELPMPNILRRPSSLQARIQNSADRTVPPPASFRKKSRADFSLLCTVGWNLIHTIWAYITWTVWHPVENPCSGTHRTHTCVRIFLGSFHPRHKQTARIPFPSLLTKWYILHIVLRGGILPPLADVFPELARFLQQLGDGGYPVRGKQRKF